MERIRFVVILLNPCLFMIPLENPLDVSSSRKLAEFWSYSKNRFGVSEAFECLLRLILILTEHIVIGSWISAADGYNLSNLNNNFHKFISINRWPIWTRALVYKKPNQLQFVHKFRLNLTKPSGGRSTPVHRIWMNIMSARTGQILLYCKIHSTSFKNCTPY